MIFRLKLGLALAFSLAPALSAIGQYRVATVCGSVSEEDGRPVPGARIESIQNGTAISLLADSSGGFCFYVATPGHHILKFQYPSVPTVGVYEIMLEPGTSSHLNVRLSRSAEPGSSPVSWKITEEAEGVTDAWRPERVITARQIESLPGSGHLWAFLSSIDASVVAERFDISGMHSNRQFLLGARGSSWTQNQALLNGSTVTHPSGDGMLIFPDMASMKEIIYTLGESPTQHTGPGPHLALIPKFGEHESHGEIHALMQCGALQNVNPTGRDRFFGITESDERWRHFVNGGFQLGGPLGGRRWTYFGSVSARDLEKWIRNHPLRVSASVTLATFSLLGQFSPKDRLGLLGTGQKLHEPQAGASPQVTRAASIDREQTQYALQAAWTRSFSPRNLLDVRLGTALSDVDARFQPGARGQSENDLFPGFSLVTVPDPPSPIAFAMVNSLSNTGRGPAPLVIPSRARSWEGSAIYSTLRGSVAKLDHEIAVGVSFRRKSLEQRYDAIDNVNLWFFQGAPDSVRLLNTPAQTRDRIDQFELHASDRITHSRLSLKVASYLDGFRGANLLSRRQSTNTLSWVNIGGRVGVAYRVLDRRPLMLHASAARIYDQPLASTWTAVNPHGLGVRTFSWKDANDDREFQARENGQFLKASGSRYTRLDPKLKNPDTTEINLGLTHALPSGIIVQLSGFRRFEHQLISLVNEGVPFSAYTPEQVVDPGGDGVLGTVDDGYITVFNQDPQTLGQDRYLLTNPKGLDASSEGLELKLRLNLRRFQAEAALTRHRTVASTAPGMSARENDTSALLGVFDDPNKAIFARGSTFFERGTVARIWATSDIGWNIRCSAVAAYQDGLPYSRYLPIVGLNQGTIGVLTRQRGSGAAGSVTGFLTTHYETIDVRLLRSFSLGIGKLTTTLDVFNLANRAQSLVQTDVSARTHLWRIPLSFQTPRSLQLGLRYQW